MNQIDNCLVPTHSKQTFQENKKACSRNVTSDFLQLEEDWRVALAELMFPSSIENITTKHYFIQETRTAKKFLSIPNRSASAVVISSKRMSRSGGGGSGPSILR